MMGSNLTFDSTWAEISYREESLRRSRTPKAWRKGTVGRADEAAAVTGRRPAADESATTALRGPERDRRAGTAQDAENDLPIAC
ncbi:hypothetical protein SAXI111661_11120 [Saccharomonospora xinjiangensis]|uniref:hypothetical protein n=1 Tax=Saccharomonospora xinjiangensis TaxID=75294 RepID=UPI00106F8ECF|nr:hypothetical protein [Saccharomonospora xinjiangensis]QBQ61109.1 hypothetical protein EYD13_13785 [Saccharomonospora xinjiangensis]